MNTTIYKIKTQRFIIRCLEPKDAILLKETIDESLNHLSTWLPWAKNEPEELDVKIQRLRISRADFDLDRGYLYGIFLLDESKLIGTIALKSTVKQDVKELGYWIHGDYINKGYGTEANSALIKAVFETSSMERIEIHCDSKNLISSAIPKKIGFNKEAVVRINEKDDKGNRKQDEIWVLFKEEYKKTDIKDLEIQAYDVINRKIL